MKHEMTITQHETSIIVSDEQEINDALRAFEQQRISAAADRLFADAAAAQDQYFAEQDADSDALRRLAQSARLIYSDDEQTRDDYAAAALQRALRTRQQRRQRAARRRRR